MEGLSTPFGQLNTQAQIYERQQNAEAAKALAALNTEKKKYVYMEALAAAKNADAHMLEAKSKELATLFETGEYTNWKTWAGSGFCWFAGHGCTGRSFPNT